MIHERPLCFAGDGVVTHDPIFAPVCGHEDCPSAVWHPLCLMSFRENSERQRQDMARFLQHHEIIIGIRPIPVEEEDTA